MIWQPGLEFYGDNYKPTSLSSFPASVFEVAGGDANLARPVNSTGKRGLMSGFSPFHDGRSGDSVMAIRRPVR